VAVLERDNRGEVMCVWSYPSVDPHTESALVSRGFPPSASNPAWFSKFKNVWQYFHTTSDIDSLLFPSVQVHFSAAPSVTAGRLQCLRTPRA
jgi:hypothetical protein